MAAVSGAMRATPVPLIVSVGGTASAAALPAGSMRASAHTAVHTNEYSEMRFMKILRSAVDKL
jgi:hypothetical protein